MGNGDLQCIYYYDLQRMQNKRRKKIEKKVIRIRHIKCQPLCDVVAKKKDI